jgi:hypothetical protein
MAVMTTNSAIRSPRPGSLYDVLDLILDKGLVIDAYVRVSLVGIELLTIDARIVVASVDTYLRFAEAANRLDLAVQNGTGLPELVSDLQEGGAQKKTQGAISGVKDSAKEAISSFGKGGDSDSDTGSGNGHRRQHAGHSSSGSSQREQRPRRRQSESNGSED